MYKPVSCILIDKMGLADVVGCLDRKTWIIGSRQTIASGGQLALTFSALTGGLIVSCESYQVLAQKLNAASTNLTAISNKTAVGFTLNGDNGGLYSLIVMLRMPSRGGFPKWAKDYCPYCKDRKYNAIVGSILKDMTLFGFTARTGLDGTANVLFKNVKAGSREKFGLEGGRKERGSGKEASVTQMYDTTYQICISKSTVTGGEVVVAPYPSNLTVTGFTLNGDAEQTYDVMIFGQIRY